MQGDVYVQPNGQANGQKPLLSVVGEEILRIISGAGKELLSIIVPQPRRSNGQSAGPILMCRCPICDKLHVYGKAA